MTMSFWKPLPWANDADIRILTGVFGRTFVWTLIGALCFIRYWVQATNDGLHPGFWPDIFTWMACFYPWVLLAPIIFRLESRFPLSWKTNDVTHFLVLALAGIPLSFAAFELRLLLTALFQFISGQHVDPISRPFAISAEEFFYHLIPYGLTLGASCLLRTLSQLRGREHEAARLALETSRLESSLRLAELESLRMRLNPHFLFNTLQNISVLTQQDPPTASLMLTRLGDLLRASFRKDSQQEIPLEAEIALTQAYLEVERMRFQDRLSVAVEVERGTENALVPTFLLQPLVENALKHGLSGPQPGNIRIRGTKQADRLVLTVEDNGAGLPAESLRELHLGVGLGATCDRLQRLYFDRQELAVRNLAEGGTEVRIALPFRLNPAPV
jgi:two-component system LytT family sensor kinase